MKWTLALTVLLSVTSAFAQSSLYGTEVKDSDKLGLARLVIKADYMNEAGKPVPPPSDSIKLKVEHEKIADPRNSAIDSSDHLKAVIQLSPLDCDESWVTEQTPVMMRTRDYQSAGHISTVRYVHLLKADSQSCVGVPSRPVTMMIDTLPAMSDGMNEAQIRIPQSNGRYAVIKYVSGRIGRRDIIISASVAYNQP